MRAVRKQKSEVSNNKTLALDETLTEQVCQSPQLYFFRLRQVSPLKLLTSVF